MFCSQCGASLPSDAKFCHTCGTGVAATHLEHSTADDAASQPAAARLPIVDASNNGSVRWGALIRDVAIVWVLTAMGGVVVSMSGPSSPARRQVGYGAANILFGTVAFIIAGCLTPAKRWRHLTQVAIATWITSIFNVVFGFTSLEAWLFGAFGMFLILGIGGFLSRFFVPSMSSASRSEKD